MSLTSRTTTAGALLLVTLLAATACDSDSSTADGASKSPAPSASATLSAQPPSPTTSPSTSPQDTPPAGTPTPPAQDGQLLGLVVSGGFAGLHNELVVKADGSYTSTRRDGQKTTGKLTPEALAGLRAALERADFAHLPPRPTGKPVADALMYQYTYGGHVVLIDDFHQTQALRDVRANLPLGYR
ncbi:hypothetical protein A8W25_20710 [Streptomyces sp. ERV7]|uniref:hypothetical protein n=1 Tax=Streptomyces sp. ERV7 TaxID=1322334 RepID=UPI0007F3CE88|nr:hypothetical protein [Streptomyces sp. ERV7]OAR24771.1 hypothetical protein A8W25_20710 [Streptomyces sp. ERV7]